MISIEVDFLFFFVSLFFLYRCLFSIANMENKSLLLTYWMGIIILTFISIHSLSRWGVSVIGWETKSIFLLLTKSNLVLYFVYQLLEERIFLYRRTIGFLITFCLFLFLGTFFYWIQMFQVEIRAEDTSRILPFTIAIGAFVWSREMFWPNLKLLELKLGDEKESKLAFLFLPCFLYVLTPFSTNYGFIEALSSAVVIGISSFVGFTLVSLILKVSIPDEAEIGVWIGTIAFSSSFGADLLVCIPMAFFVGAFARGFYFYLDQLNWTVSGKRGVVCFLFPSIIAIFLPFLVLEPKDWLHSPYVLLGVQILYFLSFYLVSSLVFGILLLLKPKSE
ncbi:hypothetical protein [Leptospira bouyouniensis]|uniref:Uncharacterized protein n=1 Tax=Leptospira bouyouniensis TaxID=2484911 RepID=A0ABY2L2H5_9LEPT|nr:hypothetical protein [Leptospira bouyouniensis]TGK47091.1 hypothetical protein EHQ10_17350 [Leptospira bouyouniensis]